MAMIRSLFLPATAGALVIWLLVRLAIPEPWSLQLAVVVVLCAAWGHLWARRWLAGD